MPTSRMPVCASHACLLLACQRLGGPRRASASVLFGPARRRPTHYCSDRIRPRPTTAETPRPRSVAGKANRHSFLPHRTQLAHSRSRSPPPHPCLHGSVFLRSRLQPTPPSARRSLTTPRRAPTQRLPQRQLLRDHAVRPVDDARPTRTAGHPTPGPPATNALPHDHNA